MKRKSPAGTIDSFFNASKEKKQASIDELMPIPRRQLTVQKTQQQKGVIHIQIPSLSDESSINEDKIKEIMAYLKEGIHLLFDDKIQNANFAKLFTNVEYICRNKTPEYLYKSISEDMQEAAMNFINSISEEFDITLISQKISLFEKCLDYFLRTFLYLDRSYIFPLRIDGFTSLSEIVYSYIRNGMSKELADLISDQILITISKYRLHEEIKLSELKTGLNFAKSTKFYNDHLEPTLLIQTKDYFEDISSHLSLKDLINWNYSSKEIETQLQECGLEKSTHLSIDSMQNEIVLKKAGQRVLFSQEFYDMIDQFDKEELKRVVSTFDKEELRKLLLKSVSSYFSTKIKSTIQSSTDQTLIPDILRIISKISDFDQFIFENSRDAVKTINESVSASMSSQRDHIAEYLARYIDSGNPLVGPSLILFKLIDASEVFESTYFHLFGRRFLSWNVDVQRENELIDTLQMNASKEYTDRLVKTINDYNQSKRILQPTSDGMEYKAMALYERDWSTNEGEIKFPEQIEILNEEFKKRYMKQQKTDSHIVLHFSAALSNCVLKVNNKSEIKMSGEQAIIVLLLSEKGPMNVDDIHNHTGINESQIKINLDILSKKPLNLLIKGDDDKWSVNKDAQFPENYSYPSTRSGNLQLQRAVIDNDINYIRTNMITSCMYKILKEFKTLKLEELISRVKKQLNFFPETEKLMFVINDLKNKDVLTQDENHVIRYVP